MIYKLKNGCEINFTTAEQLETVLRAFNETIDLQQAAKIGFIPKGYHQSSNGELKAIKDMHTTYIMNCVVKNLEIGLNELKSEKGCFTTIEIFLNAFTTTLKNSCDAYVEELQKRLEKPADSVIEDMQKLTDNRIFADGFWFSGLDELQQYQKNKSAKVKNSTIYDSLD